MAKEPVSERKRISIPKADESSLEWWNLQQDAGLSIRMLIRAEIQRNGMIDVVNSPVAQQPRRGRPPGDAEVADGGSTEIPTPVEQTVRPEPEPVTVLTSEPSHPRELEVVSARRVPVPDAVPSAGGPSLIDSIING